MNTNKIILIMALFLLTAISVNGQKSQQSEVALVQQTELKVIGVSDYANFLNIEGLDKYSNITHKGFKNGSYILRSKNQYIDLRATYDADGNLIKGKLVTKNSRLPLLIKDHLIADNYKEWTMISNKIVVRDFDANKTEYEVEMHRDGQKMKLYFDHRGNRIERLSRS